MTPQELAGSLSFAAVCMDTAARHITEAAKASGPTESALLGTAGFLRQRAADARRDAELAKVCPTCNGTEMVEQEIPNRLGLRTGGRSARRYDYKLVDCPDCQGGAK